ncbi:hypothetical protein N9Q05_01360 [bacterium]|nr:hypothetical protein [bacterium]
MSELNQINADAIVMLALSNWTTTQSQAYYEYAVSLSPVRPVIFVQADLTAAKFSFEATEIEQVWILHVYSDYHSQRQVELIASALNSKGVVSPLLWVNNPQFIQYIHQVYAPYKIYYTTETILSQSPGKSEQRLSRSGTFPLADARASDSIPGDCDMIRNLNDQQTLINVLDLVNEIICVTPTMAEAILSINYKWKNKTHLSFNRKNYDLLPTLHHEPIKYNLLVLYEKRSCSVSTIKEHVESFTKYSTHWITYADGTTIDERLPELHYFDAVIIHYSLRLSVEEGSWTLSHEVRRCLKAYAGLKIAFIQDEYETTHVAVRSLIDLGIQVVFTCVPENHINQVYPKEKLPAVRFVGNLTGYVPDFLVHYPVTPLNQRTIQIAYRGRNLPYWYGDLGQEKELIGKKMKAVCLERNMVADIEWDTVKRIYGNAWYEFLASSKATLGTESGSNVFDFDGSLSINITNYLLKNPQTPYQEIADLFLKEHEGLIKMNQISPKIFEAICLHTALILFEGDYSNILIPHIHYIVLKKDFSNINDVLEKINNDDYLTELTNRVYQDIVLSNDYSYQSFIRLFDETVNRFIPKKINTVTKNHLKLKQNRLKIPFLASLVTQLESSASVKQLKVMLRQRGYDRILVKIRSKLIRLC